MTALKRTSGWCLVAVMVACSGCLSRPAPEHKTFAFHAPAGPQRTNSSVNGVLAGCSVRVSPLFGGRSLMYRIGADQYEADPYAEFVVPPDSALAIPLRAYLRSSGVFEAVLDPGTRLKPNIMLDVNASELYGDFRRPAAPVAVLSLKVLIFRPAPEPQLVFQRDYSRRVPLKEPTAEALVAGWDQALAGIMAEATFDLAAGREQLTAQQP